MLGSLVMAPSEVGLFVRNAFPRREAVRRGRRPVLTRRARPADQVPCALVVLANNGPVVTTESFGFLIGQMAERSKAPA